MPDSDTAQSSTGTRLLLLRHGQIKANKTGRWHGSTDSPLTWRGRRQARRTGRFLAVTEQIDAVYSSPLQRCTHTANLATAHLTLDVQTLDGLQEMSLGEWEDTPFKTLATEHDLIPRLTGDHDYSAPGGESLNQVAARMRDALTRIDNAHSAGETVLVVGHGVALAVGVALFLRDTPGAWTEYRFGNCSLTELYITPQPLLVGYNETQHL